jgi:hypothetical protein
MLGDLKRIHEAKEAINPPIGGDLLLLDLNKASNAHSGNHLKEEINLRSKIDFGANFN